MNSIVAKKVRHLRLQKGLSQEQVAEHLNTSQSTYARIESGQSNSWVNYIYSICELFELQPEELIRHDDDSLSYTKNTPNCFMINQLLGKLSKQYETQLKEIGLLISEMKNLIAESNKA